MNKRILAWILSLAFLLSGCQLAKPETQRSDGEDTLAGVFVTTQYVDLWDLSDYLVEHPEAFLDGEITSNELPSRATRYPAVKDKNGNYSFEGLEGMLYACFQEKTENSQYTRLDASPGIGDGQREVRVTDEGTIYNLSGVIYVSQLATDFVFYMNPVYQTPEGDVYLVPGTGIHFGGDLAGSASQKFTHTATKTENGETTVNNSSVEITIQGIVPAESVAVLYMDSESNLIRRDSYTLEAIPEALEIPRNTAFLLVEEQLGGDVRRGLYQLEDTHFEYFRSMENGICEKASVQLNWH